MAEEKVDEEDTTASHAIPAKEIIKIRLRWVNGNGALSKEFVLLRWQYETLKKLGYLVRKIKYILKFEVNKGMR